jgi:hypothetical protein
MGTCVTESYMEKLAFTRACLSYIRVMMAIMSVFLAESLCQMVMGWILVLKYELLSACGFLWPRLIASGNKFCCFRCR